MELDPEVHSHHHKVGHRWIDLALALSALILSITSILIAIQNDHAMHNLVTANSWPYLEMGNSNVMDNASVIHFDVKNAGIGPALIEKFVVTYDGHAVKDVNDLLAQCCGIQSQDQSRKLNIYIDEVSGRVLPARDSIAFLELAKANENLNIWEKLNAVRFKVGMSACYSSVFGEHWITTLGNIKPRSVESCDALLGSSYDARGTQKAAN
jgi:hypothetical protein